RFCGRNWLPVRYAVVVSFGSTRKQRYSSVPPPGADGVYGSGTVRVSNRSPGRAAAPAGELAAGGEAPRPGTPVPPAVLQPPTTATAATMATTRMVDPNGRIEGCTAVSSPCHEPARTKPASR